MLVTWEPGDWRAAGLGILGTMREPRHALAAGGGDGQAAAGENQKTENWLME
jgi:hypothetical protein